MMDLPRLFAVFILIKYATALQYNIDKNPF